MGFEKLTALPTITVRLVSAIIEHIYHCSHLTSSVVVYQVAWKWTIKQASSINNTYSCCILL